jgi:hypothetical protein
VDLPKYIKALSRRRNKQIEPKNKASHTYLCGSPPSWGYVHQLFLFIISVKQLQHRASTILTPDRTKDLRSSLDPSSLGFNTKPCTTSYNHFHLALQASYNHAQSIYNPQNLQSTSDHTDPITSTKPPGILTLPKYLFIYYKSGPKSG